MKTVFFTIAIEPSEKLKRSFVTLSRVVVYRDKRYSLSMYGQRKDYIRFRVANHWYFTRQYNSFYIPSCRTNINSLNIEIQNMGTLSLFKSKLRTLLLSWLLCCSSLFISSFLLLLFFFLLFSPCLSKCLFECLLLLLLFYVCTIFPFQP